VIENRDEQIESFNKEMSESLNTSDPYEYADRYQIIMKKYEGLLRELMKEDD